MIKKLLAIFLGLVLLLSCSLAEPDYSSMTAEELLDVIARARTALMALDPVDDATVLYDRDGVKIYIDSIKVSEKNDSIKFNLIMINDTDSLVGMEWSAAVNGWEVHTQYANSAYVDAHLKTRDAHQTVCDICKLSGISSFDEIESIQIDARTRINDKYFYMHYIIAYENEESLRIVEREYPN